MAPKRKNIAIFASGDGSNAENIIRYSLEHPDHLNIGCLISDQPNAQVLSRGKKLNILSKAIPFIRNGFSSYKLAKADHEKRILASLKEFNIDWIFLAGYMRILSPNFLQHFYNPVMKIFKIVNIHPSLLPSFPGKNAYKQAFNSGVKISGITIHFVDPGVDTGPIILQDYFFRRENDTFEEFKQRGLELEHKLYRKFIKHFIDESISFIPICNTNKRLVYINEGS